MQLFQYIKQLIMQEQDKEILKENCYLCESNSKSIYVAIRVTFVKYVDKAYLLAISSLFRLHLFVL